MTTPLMPTPGPIIAATDLSDHGDEALRQAHGWARRRGARLIVVHGVADPTPMFAPMGQMQQMSDALKATRRDRLQTIAAHAEKLLGEPVEIEVHIGPPEEVVLRAAESHAASLVVVGGSGRGRIEQFFLGTTAEQILRHASSDVLVARPSPEGGAVMAASDLSGRSFSAVEAAAAEAEARGASLIVLHALDIAHPVLAAFEPLIVVDDKTRSDLHDACLRVLESEVERIGLGGTVEVIEGRPDRVIVTAAGESAVSLVVIATHGHTGLARMALGSVASTVSRKAPSSVLVVRAHP